MWERRSSRRQDVGRGRVVLCLVALLEALAKVVVLLSHVGRGLRLAACCVCEIMIFRLRNLRNPLPQSYPLTNAMTILGRSRDKGETVVTWTTSEWNKRRKRRLSGCFLFGRL